MVLRTIPVGVLTLAVFAGGGIAMVAACTSSDGNGNNATPVATTTNTTPAPSATCPTSPEAAAPVALDPNVAAGMAAIQAGQQTFRFDTSGDHSRRSWTS